MSENETAAAATAAQKHSARLGSLLIKAYEACCVHINAHIRVCTSERTREVKCEHTM